MGKWLLGIALVAALFATGCRDVDVPDHPDPLDHRPDDETPSSREAGDATEELRLQANDVRFVPAELMARAGVPAELTLENLDDTAHDFQIDAIDVDIVEDEAEHESGHDSTGDLVVHTEGGETDTVAFVINEPGTYEFYCTITGHKEAGMVGTLTVE